MLYAWLYCLIILCKETNCISNILTNHPKSLGKGYLRLGNYLIKFCRQFLADAFLAFAYGGCGGVAKVVATDTTKRSSEGIKSQETPLALRLVVGKREFTYGMCLCAAAPRWRRLRRRSCPSQRALPPSCPRRWPAPSSGTFPDNRTFRRSG